ncbi:hypothetical protein H0E84_17410 [Luteimonas sp. SJ-92]|uniref:Uncharacterized protein n=1 Tax=Luteimonas salinisoli TaxID=2752307 RepID=A0A853JIC3_9GAMM|nr:hypothetical protein [Luteimonas salinisoli]NZA28160.1 hypothetical protein [Luteimonas salinisoli]
MAATLRARVGESLEPARIADVLVSILREIQAALVPVMGSHGFALIYRRSLYLSATLGPLMTSLSDQEGAPGTPDFDALRSAVAQHSGVDAISNGASLLQTIHDLLVTLVGLSLTERLLRSVRANHSSGPPAPDNSS